MVIRRAGEYALTASRPGDPVYFGRHRDQIQGEELHRRRGLPWRRCPFFAGARRTEGERHVDSRPRLGGRRHLRCCGPWSVGGSPGVTTRSRLPNLLQLRCVERRPRPSTQGSAYRSQLHRRRAACPSIRTVGPASAASRPDDVESPGGTLRLGPRGERNFFHVPCNQSDRGRIHQEQRVRGRCDAESSCKRLA